MPAPSRSCGSRYAPPIRAACHQQQREGRTQRVDAADQSTWSELPSPTSEPPEPVDITGGYAGRKSLIEMLEYQKKPMPSELGLVVADILGYAFKGIYHIYGYDKVDWSNPYYIRVDLVKDCLATFDGQELTELVLLCLYKGVRLEIGRPNKRGYNLGLTFHQRQPEVKGLRFFERQPSLGMFLERIPKNMCRKIDLLGYDPAIVANPPINYERVHKRADHE